MENTIVRRGRKPNPISPFELQVAIQTLEFQQPENKFANRSALWAALQASDWAKNQPTPMSAQTAMVMAKKYDAIINTPLGKRGRQKGCAPVMGGGRKRKDIPEVAASAMRKLFPLKMKAVDRAIKGSFKAAIKLKCLDCTCNDIVEVRECPMVDCPLWAFRGYNK